jgi:hypothetical protein
LNRLPGFVVAFFGLLLMTTHAGRMQRSLPVPTFTRNVAPILFKNCVECHRPGEIAPMALRSYAEARPYARAIAAKVKSGEMPPWHADAPPGTFSNDRRLTDAEKDTLIRWAENGAPQGDAHDLPALPEFTEGWTIGQPDAIVKMPSAYSVPGNGTIEYQYFEAPSNFSEDKWVQALEIRPGARKVVHHVLVYAREPGQQAPTPAWSQIVPPPPPARNRASAPRRTDRGALIATTAPGTNATVFRPGSALLIKAGSTITFQMHYTTNGEATADQTSIGFVFAKQPPKEEVQTGAFLNAMFTLPPDSSRESVESEIEFNDDVTVWSLFPHSHLRGKAWEYTAIYPDGKQEVVLSVPFQAGR